MNDRQLHLLVVDENTAVRRALVARLDRTNDLAVIGDTGDLNKAVQLLDEHHPTVIILESKRRDSAAFEFCQRVLRVKNAPKIIILTSFANEDERLSLRHLGIEQYLLKNIATEELIRVIRDITQGVVIDS